VDCWVECGVDPWHEACLQFNSMKEKRSISIQYFGLNVFFGVKMRAIRLLKIPELLLFTFANPSSIGWFGQKP
jgi:hypothetical protein